MGIAASKVVCYTAFGGIDPSAALPVCIDAGADSRHKRLRPAL
jgi:malic enzyme